MKAPIVTLTPAQHAQLATILLAGRPKVFREVGDDDIQQALDLAYKIFEKAATQ
jgi:hypothetical protein